LASDRGVNTDLDEEHYLYSLPNVYIKSRRMRWAGHVARMGERRGWVLVGKTEGKRPFGIRCRTVKDNIKELGLKNHS
jgi:hypothetical protein